MVKEGGMGERKEAVTIELLFHPLVNFAYFQSGFEADNEAYVCNWTIVKKIKGKRRVKKKTGLKLNI